MNDPTAADIRGARCAVRRAIETVLSDGEAHPEVEVRRAAFAAVPDNVAHHNYVRRRRNAGVTDWADVPVEARVRSGANDMIYEVMRRPLGLRRGSSPVWSMSDGLIRRVA